MEAYIVVGSRPIGGHPEVQFWANRDYPVGRWVTDIAAATRFNQEQAEDMKRRLECAGSFEPIAVLPENLAEGLVRMTPPAEAV